MMNDEASISAQNDSLFFQADVVNREIGRLDRLETISEILPTPSLLELDGVAANPVQALPKHCR